MEIRHLRYFLAVADLRNFTRAAEASFVAQSALSQQIGRLEHEIGASLFVRGNRRIELTPAGELLLPHARRLVGGEATARAEMRSYLGLEKGRLRLGLIQTANSVVDTLSPLARFHEVHPEVEIHVSNATSTDMIEAVREGRLDLAVVGLGRHELPDDLEHHQLAVDPLVGVLPTASAAGLSGPIAIVDLLAHGRLIHFVPGTGIRRHVDEALNRAGVNAVPSFEVGQVCDMVRFAAVGLGVAIVPRTLAESTDCGIDGLRFSVVGLNDPDALHLVSVIHDSARVSAAGKKFLALLAQNARKKPKRSV
ncbi:LysR family transcriptional regulator [Kineosporia sp. NBRC 101731]|uniref:LysR family transcriptional regulator n=1 Tax=Kineosporia sp. NBRC 101731 TaxID=3032199 RepID=UPI002555A742|nr:LysR family transcriptional regulator [Kineosporia sp. NBRC 101731]